MESSSYKEVAMSVPKVFFSYSHDTQEHKKWVLDLATRLMSYGIDAILDQWELSPGGDLPRFMEQLTQVDKVLMICTEKYVEKANAGDGGVGYEKMIVTSELLSKIDSNKVIPIIRQSATNDVPTFLKTKLYIDFSKDDEYEFSIDELARAVLGSPLFKKPEIGNNPFVPIEESRPEQHNDLALKILKVLIRQYNRGGDWVMNKEISSHLGISRVICDVLLKKLIDDGLIEQEYFRSVICVRLSDKGKQYAVTHNLVS